MLPMKIEFWYCQWELGFDVANENWVLNSANVSWVFWYCQWELGFDIANENWVLILPMRIEFWCCQWKLGFDIANEKWVLDK